MTEQQIFEKLLVIIDDIKGDTDGITRDTKLIESSIMDSLEIINYLTQIEEQFDLSISMDALAEHKLGGLGNMADYIMAHVK